MARQLEHNDELGLPWDEWADGRPARIARGRDFYQPISVLQKAAQNAAQRLGRAVRVIPQIRVDREYAWVQFADHEVTIGDPCPGCESLDVRRINALLAECDRCKASLILVVPKRREGMDEPPGMGTGKDDEVLRLLLRSAPARLERVNEAKMQRAAMREAKAQQAGKMEQPANPAQALNAGEAEQPTGPAAASSAEQAADVAALGKSRHVASKARLRRRAARRERASAVRPVVNDVPAATESVPAAREAKPAVDRRPGKGKRSSNEYAALDSARLLGADDEPMATISFDEECRVAIALEVVKPQVEVRGVLALLAGETIRYRAVQQEAFKAPSGGFHLLTVRIPPLMIDPGTYSARIGALLTYEGELSRIVRGDAFVFEVLPLEPEEAQQASAASDGEPGVPVELADASWSVSRGRKAHVVARRWTG
jgi:hypothetical protein